ncbi:hypothetical protein JCM31598_41520 [Desulfonatronum parangueonense]
MPKNRDNPEHSLNSYEEFITDKLIPVQPEGKAELGSLSQ